MFEAIDLLHTDETADVLDDLADTEWPASPNSSSKR